MSTDNSLIEPLDVKKTEVDPSEAQRRRWSGAPMFPYLDPLADAKSSPPSPETPSFIHRPFPPSPLAGVPEAYIVDQLRNLAPNYWNKPETADCTISESSLPSSITKLIYIYSVVVPVPHARGRSSHFPSEPLPSLQQYPAGLGRRATEPALNFVPQMSLKVKTLDKYTVIEYAHTILYQLHSDYLSAHSSYLRNLFSGASPLDLINTTPTDSPPPPYRSPSPSRLSSSPQFTFTIPANRLPRLLPSPPSHPILFLPVPDPSSFHLLVHWMYFGKTDFIEDCLNKGIIQWEGIARNVEYLGLRTEIKIFLGRWYGDWLHPERARCESPLYFDDEDEDDDTMYGSDDGDSSTAGSDDDMDDEKDPQLRGRTRAPRPLSSIRGAPRHFSA